MANVSLINYRSIKNQICEQTQEIVNIILVNSDEEADLTEFDLSEHGIIGIQSDEVMFYDRLQEVFIHRTFKSPCPAISNAEIEMAKQITGCKTKSSKIESNRKQLSTLCDESWTNVTSALGELY